MFGMLICLFTLMDIHTVICKEGHLSATEIKQL